MYLQHNISSRNKQEINDIYRVREVLKLDVNPYASLLNYHLHEHILPVDEGWYLPTSLVPVIVPTKRYYYHNGEMVDYNNPYRIKDVIVDNDGRVIVDKWHLDNEILTKTPNVLIRELYIIEDIVHNYIVTINQYSKLLPPTHGIVDYLGLHFTDEASILYANGDIAIDDYLMELLGLIESFIINKPEYIYYVNADTNGELTIGRTIDVRAYRYIIQELEKDDYREY